MWNQTKAGAHRVCIFRFGTLLAFTVFTVFPLFLIILLVESTRKLETTLGETL